MGNARIVDKAACKIVGGAAMSAKVGRPHLTIDLEKLRISAADGLTGKEAARSLGISRATFTKRMREDVRFRAVWRDTPREKKRPMRGKVLPIAAQDLRVLAAADRDAGDIARADFGLSLDSLRRRLSKCEEHASAWREGRAARIFGDNQLSVENLQALTGAGEIIRKVAAEVGCPLGVLVRFSYEQARTVAGS